MTSPVVSVCPHCDKKIKVKKPELVGKKVKCPGCAQPFVLEVADAGDTYSIAQKPAEPQSSSPHDEWLDALGAAEESGAPISSPQSSGGLPPLANQTKKKKKKKPREFGAEPVPGSDDDDRYGYSVEEGMTKGLIGGTIGGVICGVVGALIWGGISYGTGYEVSYVAWGVGILVGFGVLAGAQEYAGVTTGILALVLANLSIFGGKVFAIWMMLAGIAPQFDVDVQTDFVTTESYLISEIADEIADKRQAAGEQVKWPRDDMATFDFSVDYPPAVWQKAEQRWKTMPADEKNALMLEYEVEANASESFKISCVADEILFEEDEWDELFEEGNYDYSVDYPPDIWEEAEAQWNALTPQQQQARKEESEEIFEDFNILDNAGLSVLEITWNSLGPFDGLWIILASFTAYRIGANEHEDD